MIHIFLETVSFYLILFFIVCLSVAAKIGL